MATESRVSDPSKRTKPRAKSKRPDGTELPKPERIRHIVGLMSRNEYKSGDTVRELAALWGISEKSVEGDAAEASRIVRMFAGSADEIRKAAMEMLAQIAAEARWFGPTHHGYYRAATEAVGLLTGLGGAPPTTRTEHTGKDGAPIVPAKIGILLPEEEGEPGVESPAVTSPEEGQEPKP